MELPALPAGSRRTLVQRVISNSFWSIVSQGLGRGVNFLAQLYLARVLGVASYGRFTLAQYVALSLWTSVDLGTAMYGTREIAKDKEHAEEIVNDLLSLRVVVALSVLVLFSTVVLLIPLPAERRLALVACGLYVVTYSLYTDWVCRGLERFEYITIGTFLMGAALLAGIVLFVRGQGGLLAACLAWSLSALLGAVPLLLVLRSKLGIRLRLRFRPRAWLHHARESVFFATGGILLSVYQYLPAFLLEIFFASYVVGLFSAPFRIVVTLGAAGFLIPMAFYPILADLHKKDNARFLKTQRAMRVLMLVLGLPVGIAGTLFASPLVKLLFGAQYADSIPAFKILVWLVPLWFFRYTYGMTMAATGLQRRQNLAALGATAGMVVLGLLLIPRFGLLGGAWAVVGSETLLIAFMHGLSRPAFEMPA